jgi:hypothetical protein
MEIEAFSFTRDVFFDVLTARSTMGLMRFAIADFDRWALSAACFEVLTLPSSS